MARVLFFALLAMCLACFLQGSPVGDQAEAPSATKQLENAVRDTAAAVQRGAQELMNNPATQQLLHDLQNVTSQLASYAKQKLDEALPKTA